MKTKILKKMLITTICFCIIGLISIITNENTKVIATTENNLINQQEMVKIAGIDDIIDAGNNFIEKGESGANEIIKDKEDLNISPEGFAGMFVDIGSVLVAIGVVTLLIVSAVMAIKWITATPDKQAKLKQQLIGLVVAAVVIFGAIGIWSLVRGIMENVEGTLNGENDPASQVTTPSTTIPQTQTTVKQPDNGGSSSGGGQHR